MFLANKIIYLQSHSTAVHLIQNVSKQMLQKNSGYRLHASLAFLPLPTRAQISFATYNGIRQLRSLSFGRVQHMSKKHATLSGLFVLRIDDNLLSSYLLCD